MGASAAEKSWETGQASKRAAEADAESLQTHDMYIPVIYLSYSLGQRTMLCLHWCQPIMICLGCVFGMHGPMCASCFIVFLTV